MVKPEVAKKPEVSVIVTTYNHEHYVSECLDGILMQRTSFPFEIIIVDDASTDSTPYIISEYQKRYPDIIRANLLTTNYYQQKRSKFFEIFFPQCRGKYIAFCEGDDYWTFPDKIQRQYEFLESHPEYSMCFHNHRTIFENGCQPDFKYPKLRFNATAQPDALILLYYAHTATLMTRLDFILSDTELKDNCQKIGNSFTDNMFLLSFAKHGKTYGFAKDWSVYRRSNQGLITSNRNKFSSITGTIRKIQYSAYNSKFKNLKQQNRILQTLNCWVVSRNEKHYAQAVRFLWRAFRINPSYFIKFYIRRFFL